jgi:hypothetical protein
MNTIKYEDTIPGEAVLPKDLKVDGIYYHGDQLVRIDGVRLIPKLVEMVQILESRQTINDVRLHAKLDTIIVLLERLIASTMAEPQP